MKLWQIYIALLLTSAAFTTSAGELSYTCDVKHIYSLSEIGKLEISNWEKQMVGSSFSVSRITGEIVSEVVPTLRAKTTRVINSGSKDNSFKAVADFEGQIQVIEIKEFEESMTKPFIAMSMGGAGLVTGTCK